MSSEEQFKRINDKLQLLLKKYDQLQKENEKLKSELLPAKQREMGFMEQIGSLEQKVLLLKAGLNKMETSDKKELDKKLHTYLKEIDRCIHLLGE